MATTTPNFGWPVPTSTDLVKDGATAIEALGDGVDASLVDLKGGTTGQILAKATSADMDFAWITNDVGDITAVTAGTGISGGGTSGAVTVTNSMATAITTKGDLVPGTGSGTFARLAAGNNGETLVADSSTSTGLRYTGNYAAGKNAIINGDFNINQRAFTSITASGTDQFGFDRWLTLGNTGTVTYTPQTFTPGAAPVAGYEGANFSRVATSGQSASNAYATLTQRIESVRTFAGQTVTVSFWAKADTGTPAISIVAGQSFGSGGSPSAFVTGSVAAGTTAKKTISTSWVRYSATLTIPSISGKTIGTTPNTSYLQFEFWLSAGTNFNTRTDSLGVQNNTIDIWGVQVEAGSVATAFQTASGSIAGELALAQRYYWRSSNTDIFSGHGNGSADTTTASSMVLINPVPMRIGATSIDFSTLCLFDGASAVVAVTGATLSRASNRSTTVALTVASGLTQFRPYALINNNNAAGYIGASAEL